MAVTNQAEFDASVAKAEEAKKLSIQYYDAFKQAVKNGNTQLDLYVGQITAIRNDSTLSNTEKKQKELEIRKGPVAEIGSITVADSRTYFLQTSEIPSTLSDPIKNTYLKNMAESIQSQQAAIDKNNSSIAKLEAELGQPNQSTENKTPTENPEETKPAENKVQDNNATPAVTGTAESNEGNLTPIAQNDEDVYKGRAVEVKGVGDKGDRLTPVRPSNPLSAFSSYTYNISLYGITPEAYNNWNVNGKWLTKDLSLLMQSGGINSKLDGARNEFFDLDFTIDDLEIITLTNAKATRFAGNQSGFKFKIYEPTGVSFLSRLVNAQVKIQERTNIKSDIKQQIQALQCPFLLVIRFYGYDEKGKLVKNLTDPNSNSSTKTDSNSNFERAFPIIFSKLTFKLDGKVTVYDIEAKMLNENIGYGSEKGVIKTGFEIVSDTVSNAINSLLDKVNKQQKDLTIAPKDPKSSAPQEIADVYKVMFEDQSGIADALIVDQDYYVKTYTPSSTGISYASQVNERTAQISTQSVTKDQRIIKIAEGSSVLTAIEAIITQSTFIKNSLNKLEKEELQKKQPNDSSVQTTSEQLDLYWYTTRPMVKIIGYDKARNQYAHEITYNVIKYRIPHVQTLYLNKTLKYHGPHKIYEYYYSGNNTEIIDFNATFNLAYYNIGSLASSAPNATNSNDSVRNSREPGQNGDSTNKLPGTNELVNSLKSYLYSPTDLLNATISILGDPDYLMPGQAGDAANMFKLFYGPDFTINPNSGEVFIEIGFKQVKDYDTYWGILEPQDNVVFWTYPQDSEIQRRTNGRMVYMLTQVTSRFSGGVFKQELKSVIPSFIDQPKGAGGSGGGLRADENQSQAEVNRLLRQNANKTKPNIVSKPKLPSKPPSTVSSSAAGMKNYKPRFTQTVNDDNAPVRIRDLDKVNNFQLEEYRKKLAAVNKKDSAKPSRSQTGRLEGK